MCFCFSILRRNPRAKGQRELKKKLSRQDREAREFANQKAPAKFLETLYAMADFYSGKVAPTADAIQQVFFCVRALPLTGNGTSSEVPVLANRSRMY